MVTEFAEHPLHHVRVALVDLVDRQYHAVEARRLGEIESSLEAEVDRAGLGSSGQRVEGFSGESMKRPRGGGVARPFAHGRESGPLETPRRIFDQRSVAGQERELPRRTKLVKELPDKGRLAAPVPAPDQEVPGVIDDAHGGGAHLGDPTHEDAIDGRVGGLGLDEGILGQIESIEELLPAVEGPVHDAHVAFSCAASASRKTSSMSERSSGPGSARSR